MHWQSQEFKPYNNEQAYRGPFNLEHVSRKPEFLWLPSRHQALTEQIYLNMRRALDRARRGNILINSNDYVLGSGSALSGREASCLAAGSRRCGLEPRDASVVPADLERVPWPKTVKAVAAILGNSTLMAGVVFAVVK